jgi:flagellar basal-body rod modification protein FlgD
MSVTADISSMYSNAVEPYTARASVINGGVDTTTSKVTGNRNSGLFKDATENSLKKDDFLKLLVTQLQFQDPLNPMENTEFVAQLAQFSSLESSSNVEAAIVALNESYNKSVSAQNVASQSITNTSAVSLIGKDVRLRQTSVEWIAKAGEEVSMKIHLGNSSSATVQLLDSDDNVVKTLKTTGKDKENSSELKWDGTTDSGEIAKAGKYKIKIEGEDTDTSLYSFVQDIIEGVRFSADGALVKIGGKEISIANVLDVSMTGSNETGLSSLSASSAISLLGKQVRLRETSVRFTGEEESVHINAGGLKNGSVNVSLIDSAGKEVYNEDLTVDSYGDALFTWNGQNNAGEIVPVGEYKISIKGEKTNSSLYAYSENIVNGVINNAGGGSQIRVNGKSIDLSKIIDISEPA